MTQIQKKPEALLWGCLFLAVLALLFGLSQKIFFLSSDPSTYHYVIPGITPGGECDESTASDPAVSFASSLRSVLEYWGSSPDSLGDSSARASALFFKDGTFDFDALQTWLAARGLVVRAEYLSPVAELEPYIGEVKPMPLIFEQPLTPDRLDVDTFRVLAGLDLRTDQVVVSDCLHALQYRESLSAFTKLWDLGSEAARYRYLIILPKDETTLRPRAEKAGSPANSP